MTALPPPPAACRRQQPFEVRTSVCLQVYAFDNWAAHRSTRRYLRHFLGIFSSRIVSGLRWPLLLVALEATCVCLYEGALKGGMLPAGFRSIQIKVSCRQAANGAADFHHATWH